MRYFLFALAPIVLSFACAHTTQAPPASPTYTTGAPLWDAGPTEAPSQGWDNPKSNQQAAPPESILKDTGSR